MIDEKLLIEFLFQRYFIWDSAAMASNDPIDIQVALELDYIIEKIKEMKNESTK